MSVDVIVTAASVVLLVASLLLLALAVRLWRRVRAAERALQPYQDAAAMRATFERRVRARFGVEGADDDWPSSTDQPQTTAMGRA